MEPLDIPRRPVHETATRYAQIRPEIHLFERDTVGGGTGLSLSHWIDWELWDLVQKYFVEAEEGDWYCSKADAAAVEEALYILPENRWEMVQAREARETSHAPQEGQSNTDTQDRNTEPR